MFGGGWLNVLIAQPGVEPDVLFFAHQVNGLFPKTAHLLDKLVHQQR